MRSLSLLRIFCYDASKEVGALNFNHREEHVDDDMLLIQANLDDMNPEWMSYIMDKLFEVGANDVFVIPIIMKKGRPGIMLNVLVEDKHLSVIEDVIFSETTTLGIRYLHASCHRLARTFEQVQTQWGLLTVKVGYHNGKLVQYAPEFKQCEQVAKLQGIPLKQVYEEVRIQFAQQNQQNASS
ncbi:LarC family nickel insertion protein [Paenibacillus sp. N3.4]|nr:LarC family nickel insertion protein [Paenibacillus sp. N3.4]